MECSAGLGKPISAPDAAARFRARTIHNPVLKASSRKLNQVQPDRQPKPHPFLKPGLRKRKKRLYVMDDTMYKDHIDRQRHNDSLSTAFSGSSTVINEFKKFL